MAFLLAGCGSGDGSSNGVNPSQPGQWSSTLIERWAVQCGQSAQASGWPASLAACMGYCRCLYTEASKKFEFNDYYQNYRARNHQLFLDKTIESCLNQNGIRL